MRKDAKGKISTIIGKKNQGKQDVTTKMGNKAEQPASYYEQRKRRRQQY